MVACPGADREAGFSLLEVLVSMAVIGTVMVALTSFFVGANAISRQQGDSQAGVQVAVEATEQVRALRGSELAKGRDQNSTDVQWNTPATPAVAAYLATMEKVFDSAPPAPVDGVPYQPELPTTPEEISRNGITYQRHIYLGACWQPADGQTCDRTNGSGYLPFFRVVVAVTWPSRQCPLARCSYVTATLVSSSPNEPIFNPNVTPDPPVTQDPGPQSGQVGVPAEAQVSATDGSPPLSWTTATGLPPGLVMDASGLISGTPTTAGTYTWRATVRDADNRTATTVSNSWTIQPRVALNAISNQSATSDRAVAPVTAQRTGGTGPFGWAASGLPPGLGIDSNGVISGTPDRPAATTVHSVTVTVTDSRPQSAQRTFSWTVIPSLRIDAPVDPQVTKGNKDVAVQVVTSGGSGTLATCTATGLPTGLTINNTCLISGKPTGSGNAFSSTITATDTAGNTATRVLLWEVGN